MIVLRRPTSDVLVSAYTGLAVSPRILVCNLWLWLGGYCDKRQQIDVLSVFKYPGMWRGRDTSAVPATGNDKGEFRKTRVVLFKHV